MIINSLLDTDFYKYTMGQFAFYKNPDQKKEAEYSMKCRSGHDLIKIKDQLKKEIDHWLSLKYTEDELLYLTNLKVNDSIVFSIDYIDFLKNIDLKNNIKYTICIENDQLNIRVNGDWKYAIFAEVPFLAIVQELYWKNQLTSDEYHKAELNFEKRLIEKTDYIKKTKIKFAEFGSRRRFSLKMQELATKYFRDNASLNLLGTSNVLLAKTLNINPIGSFAHEALMAYQVIGSSFENSQKDFLNDWINVYPDKFKIALSDIFGTDMFLIDFDKKLSNKYDGVRQDSGDPRVAALKYKQHYEKMGIDTKSKTVLFSDDLNFEKAYDLLKEFDKTFNVIFGIGTYCSNDTGLKPVSIVMKLVRLNNKDVIKVSDSPGKIMCEDKKTIDYTINYIKERTTNER